MTASRNGLSFAGKNLWKINSFAVVRLINWGTSIGFWRETMQWFGQKNTGRWEKSVVFIILNFQKLLKAYLTAEISQNLKLFYWCFAKIFKVIPSSPNICKNHQFTTNSHLNQNNFPTFIWKVLQFLSRYFRHLIRNTIREAQSTLINCAALKIKTSIKQQRLVFK